MLKKKTRVEEYFLRFMSQFQTREDAFKLFLEQAHFFTKGAVMLDLDGTALHEKDGKIRVPESIKRGLKALNALERPITLNTLRFPLSLIRTIGPEWLAINEAPIPVTLLNGSVLGYIRKDKENKNELEFEEIQSFPMTDQEIDTVIDGVEKFTSAGLKDVILFYYPRDWKFGELIWTPTPECIPDLEKKYTSCSAVVSTELSKLREELKRLETCMIFLLINAEGDNLMAYQHTHKHSYFTHEGIDKTAGAKAMAEHLKVSLEDSIGAGDTELDTFLDVVGLSIHVRNEELPYQGKHATLNLKDARELGTFLEEMATLSRNS